MNTLPRDSGAQHSVIQLAKDGDIRAFHELFTVFQKDLKSYIYRLVASRSDAEDLLHDTFVRAFDKLSQFEERSNLKTWVFSIATNLCLDFLRARKRWSVNSQDKSRAYAESNIDVEEALTRTNKYSAHGAYVVREHIDFCFTCMSKTLPIEEQVAIILKDIYSFSVKETANIVKASFGTTRHYLHNGRKSMNVIFNGRCALVNKNGVCHQCSELNGYFNHRQTEQRELIEKQLRDDLKNHKNSGLYRLRADLVRQIDPLEAEGSELHEVFMQITRKVEGEIDEVDY